MHLSLFQHFRLLFDCWPGSVLVHMYTQLWGGGKLACEFIRSSCQGQFGRLMETQVCFHYISFLNMWLWFCCFLTGRAICTISVNAHLKEWIKLWFCRVLFAQSPTVLRQSSRKLFSVCDETPCEGLWKNSVRVYRPPVASKLCKKVSKGEPCLTGDCATSHGWQRVVRNQCFQTFTTTEVLFSSHIRLSCSLCPCTVPCRSSCRIDYTLEDRTQTLHHRVC